MIAREIWAHQVTPSSEPRVRSSSRVSLRRAPRSRLLAGHHTCCYLQPRMNQTLIRLSQIFALGGIVLMFTACSALRSEFTNDAQPSQPPPVSAQLGEASQIASAALPPPYGALVATLCAGLSSLATGFSVWHAKKAQKASQSAQMAESGTKVIAAAVQKT